MLAIRRCPHKFFIVMQSDVDNGDIALRGRSSTVPVMWNLALGKVVVPMAAMERGQLDQ